MERKNRSDVGDIEHPIYRTEYNITQTSSTEDHMTHLARGMYPSDQPIRHEDNAMTRVNIENAGLEEPFRCEEYYTSTPTDDSVLNRRTLSEFFSPRPYFRSISPISHVTWNQPINDRFLGHSFEDFPDHTNYVSNSWTKETKDTRYDHKENETHMAVVVIGDDHENKGNMTDVVVEGAGELENIIDDDDTASGDWEEFDQLQKAFEEIMKKKEQIDELVERQQLALEEQDRILEDVMQIARAEHDGIEKVAGEYAKNMKTYTHFKEETTNRRVYHKEVEIQADILHEENDELANEISELVFKINEIEEHRHVGVKSLKEKTEEMKCVAEQMKEDNDRLESDIKKKVEEFSNLRMELNDRGIPYVSERKPVQENGIKTKKPFPLIEDNPLKINIESMIERLSTLDTARDETSPKKVLEQVTMTSDKEVEKELTGKADLNAGCGYEIESCYDTGSEKVQDLNKDVSALEKKLRTEGSGDDVELCNDTRSEKAQDLNKDVDDFEKKPLEMKLRIECSGDEMDKGSENVQDLDTEIDKFKMNALETETRTEGCCGEMDLCYDNESEKVQDLNKDVDDFEKKALEMKLRIFALSSDLDTLLAHESFAVEKEKDGDANDRRISECFEGQCMGDENNYTDKDNAPQEQFPEKPGFENNMIEMDTDRSCQEKLKPTKQLSAVELVRFPDKRDKKTKIPKPIFHPFGSAVRDGDRHVVSKKSTSVVMLREDYDRKRYVPQDQRNAFEAVAGYFGAESEIQPTMKYQSPLDSKRYPAEIEQTGLANKTTGMLNKIRKDEIKSKINTGRQNIERRTKDDGENSSTVNLPKDKNQSLKKSLKTKQRGKVTEPFHPRRSEIKPRIDTGLNALKQKQANPGLKKVKLSNQNKAKYDSHVEKDSTDKLVSHAKSKIDKPTKPTKPAVSRNVPKPKQLPPLKMKKIKSYTGKTVANSCNNTVPLPKIKPARQQDDHELTSFNKIPNKQEITRCPLPPIGRSKFSSRHGSDNKVNVSISKSSGDLMGGSQSSPVTHSIIEKLPLMESGHCTSLTRFADPSILPNLSPSERLSPPIATSPTKENLHPEPELIPLHRKHALSKSTVHAQQREPAVTWHLFSPSPPPPSSRRPRSRRLCKPGNMPILANSPTTDLDRKPHSRA